MYQGITSYNSNSSSKFYFNYDVVSYNVPTKEELEARKEAVKHLSYNVPTRAEYDLFKLLTNPKRSFIDVIATMPPNDIVQANIGKAWSILNRTYEGPIAVAVSGGSDSDIIVDITAKCMNNPRNEVYYYFVNTGLESKATHEHIAYLESRYNIYIHRLRANVPIPTSVKNNGIPFISKLVSEFISRLQKHGFNWEDEDYATLVEKYCKKADVEKKKALDSGAPKGHWVKVGDNWYEGCISALEWWCNTKYKDGNGRVSQYDIAYNTWLKEFIISEQGLPFKVSNQCCQESKKDTLYTALNGINPSLSIQGVRKAEGGVRKNAYKSCFGSSDKHPWEEYRPLFWYLNKDKAEYNEYCGIKNSALYDYQKRTGCAGCPCSRDLQTEREALHALGEDNMIKAMDFVFGPSYEFTKKYREFQKKMNKKGKQNKVDYYQMNIFDFIA